MKTRRPLYRNQIMNLLSLPPGSTRADWGAAITRQLCEGFVQELSKPDRAVLNAGTPENEVERLVEKLDKYILDQASTVGWRILASPLVECRMKHWERRRQSDNFEKLGHAMGDAVRMLAGEKRVPISGPAWPARRREFKAELDVLFRQCRGFAQQRHRHRVTPADIIAFVQAGIERGSGEFPNLHRDRDEFLAFFRLRADDLSARLVAGRSPSPAGFFDEWMGSRVGMSRQKFGQRMSKIQKSVSLLTS